MSEADYRRTIPTREQCAANEYPTEEGEMVSAWLALPWPLIVPVVLIASWEERSEVGGPCVRWDALIPNTSPVGYETKCLRVRPDDGWRFAPMAPQTFAFRSWDELEVGR
jgi:hypothetical protein